MEAALFTLLQHSLQSIVLFNLLEGLLPTILVNLSVSCEGELTVLWFAFEV